MAWPGRGGSVGETLEGSSRVLTVYFCTNLVGTLIRPLDIIRP